MTMGKSWDTHGPTGPVVTADELTDPHSLRIRTWVDDDLRQDATTAQMITNCWELIAFLDRVHLAARHHHRHRNARWRRVRDGSARDASTPACVCASRSRGSARSTTQWLRSQAAQCSRSNEWRVLLEPEKHSPVELSVHLEAQQPVAVDRTKVGDRGDVSGLESLCPTTRSRGRGSPHRRGSGAHPRRSRVACVPG